MAIDNKPMRSQTLSRSSDSGSGLVLSVTALVFPQTALANWIVGQKWKRRALVCRAA
jgi:hypothetical protein